MFFGAPTTKVPYYLGVDFELPSDDHPLRQEIRGWVGKNPNPSGKDLAEAGLVAPHWPTPWGRGADPIEQLIIDDELRKANVRRPSNPIGIGWAGPTLVVAGSEEQQQKYLPGLLSGEEVWCQLFSEPDAGSDLASLRTYAERDGDEWVVNGTKVWTSMAHNSQYGILIARTNRDVPKQQGISYFICPMDLPGVEIHPLIEMTGSHMFNQVSLTDVRLPADMLVGELNGGWKLAKVTLGNERVSLSSGGSLWGFGPTIDDLLDVIKKSEVELDPIHRDEVARVYTEAEILRLLRLRVVSAVVAGVEPGPEVSIRKTLADEHGQNLMALAKSLTGAGGMLSDQGPLGQSVDFWHYGYLFAPALTIGGGTSEVQRNIIAERVLGLPGDPQVD